MLQYLSAFSGFPYLTRHPALQTTGGTTAATSCTSFNSTFLPTPLLTNFQHIFPASPPRRVPLAGSMVSKTVHSSLWAIPLAAAVCMSWLSLGKSLVPADQPMNSARAALDEPELFRSLFLVDAIIYPLQPAAPRANDWVRGLVTGAVRRRDGWASRYVLPASHASRLVPTRFSPITVVKAKKHTGSLPRRHSFKPGTPPLSRCTSQAHCTTRQTGRSS